MNLRRIDPSRPPSLETLERRRWQLWVVAGLFLLAVCVTVVLAFAGGLAAEILPHVPALPYSFLALAVAFLLYVADQERVLRSLTRAFLSQRVRTAALEGRVADLDALSGMSRRVNSVLTLDDVATVILDSAFELAFPRAGCVLLREGEALRVAASGGSGAPPVGEVRGFGAALAGWVAERGESFLVTGDPVGRGDRARAGIRPSGSAIVAPLVAGGDVRGVLCLERRADDPEFTDLELRSVELFAEHAATAVLNAGRYEQERRTAARLADVVELRSEFVATMVHDLKGPLTAILGFTGLMRRGWDRLGTEERRFALHSVDTQGQRLLRMIEEILRSASLEAGAELHREPVDVVALLEEVGAAASAAALSHEGVERRVTVRHDGGSSWAHGDAEALRQVFTNLVDNAVKYSRAGSPVDLRVVGGGASVEVHVTDHGPGIQAEDLPHVFERFRQGSGRRGGVGLGLYIARTLVGAHGGRVWVASKPGVGSTFSVALPVPAPAGADGQAQLSAT